MTGLKWVGDEVDVERLHLFDGDSVRLDVWVLDIHISDAVDEVIDDLSFDFELIFKSVSEEIYGNESIVCWVEWFKLLI